MTTIKEYKAMMEGATDAPWYISRRSETGVAADNERGICSTGGYLDNSRNSDELMQENKSNADFIAASRNIAPELIRVIELAEVALETCGVNRHGQEYHDWDKIKQALSEIRKLKGE